MQRRRAQGRDLPQGSRKDLGIEEMPTARAEAFLQSRPSSAAHTSAVCSAGTSCCHRGHIARPRAFSAPPGGSRDLDTHRVAAGSPGANHPPSRLQTGLRSRTGLVRARGQSSHFQKPPRATQSRLQKPRCFLGTAAEPWTDTTARFTKIFQPLKVQIKALEGFSEAPQHLHPSSSCITGAPGKSLLGQPRPQVLCAAGGGSSTPMRHVGPAGSSSLALRTQKTLPPFR